MATSYDDDDSGKWRESSDVSSAKAPMPAEAAPVTIEKKPSPPPGLVQDDLKPGMHVRLKCTCEGFIKTVTNSDYREDRWFTFIPTKISCLMMGNIRKDLEYYYSEYPVEGKMETYHADSFSSVLPAFECVAPSWFPNVDYMPRSSNDKRALHIRLIDGMDLIIPGCLMNQKVYQVANQLREMAPKLLEVKVIEVQGGISEDTMKPAAALLENFSKTSTKSAKERNVEVLFNWLISSLYSTPREMPIHIPGVSAVTRDKAREVLAAVAKHPLWMQNSIELTSSEGYVVLLGSDGVVK